MKITRCRSWHPALFGAAFAVALAGCESPVSENSGTANTYGCGQDGRLEAELYGAIRAAIRWQADTLQCEGMPRPAGAGARLRLSGPLDVDGEPRTLAFIIGIPALERGAIGKELPTNVTLMEEGAGRFFGTQDTSGCWTDVERQDAVGQQEPTAYRISGAVYCVSPLAELNGSSSVSFTELEFTGRLDWELPE